MRVVPCSLSCFFVCLCFLSSGCPSIDGLIDSHAPDASPEASPDASLPDDSWKSPVPTPQQVEWMEDERTPGILWFQKVDDTMRLYYNDAKAYCSEMGGTLPNRAQIKAVMPLPDATTGTGAVSYLTQDKLFWVLGEEVRKGEDIGLLPGAPDMPNHFWHINYKEWPLLVGKVPEKTWWTGAGWVVWWVVGADAAWTSPKEMSGFVTCVKPKL